jgi:hypothetical protein
MKKLLFLLLITTLTPALALADRNDSGGGGNWGGSRDSGGGNWDGGGSARPSDSFDSDRSFSGSDNGNGGNNWNGGRSYSSGSSYHSQILPGTYRHSVMGLPSRGYNGRAFSGSVLPSHSMSSASVRTRMSGVVREAAFSGRFNNYIATESVTGHYYWHSWNGQNFCHYRDRWGCQWFGWYVGAGFFWSQYYAGNWWWWDPDYDYWNYWYNGNWYWQNPNTQVVYVYNNGAYTPADNGGDDNQADGNNADNNPAPPSPSSPHPSNTQANTAANLSASANLNQGIVNFKSPDGTKLVQIQGDSADAFLVDKTGGKSSQPVYLASNVSGVKYVKKGVKLEIKLTMTDGSSKFYNADGSALDIDPPAASSAPAPQDKNLDGSDQ